MDGDSRSRPSGRPSPKLDIEILLPAGLRVPGLAAWLQSVAPARARGVMTVAVVSDARVRALNRDYRKKDKNTDVLSFPAEGPAKAGRYDRGVAGRYDRGVAGRYDRGVAGRYDGGVAGGYDRGVGPGFSRASQARFLGDVVIAAGVAKRQAREAGHSIQTELRILALHGLLHLLGYDHEDDDGRMARLERRLRRKGGLREGLIERSGS